MPATSKIMKPAPSNSSQADTPPSSPTLPLSEQVITVGLVQQFMDMLRVAVATQAIPATTPQAAEPQAAGNAQPEEARARASRLEFKTVDEVWDATASKYKIVEASTSPPEVDQLDEYIFVVRMRIDKKTENPAHFIDVKSEALRDILRTVLQDVNGISLREDKPTVERNLLYHYLPELEAYGSGADTALLHDSLKHLDLLVDHIKSAYASTTHRLTSLLSNGEITYDLLWALFKPNSVVYGKCFGTNKPRCIKYDFGEEKKLNDDTKYFHIEGRYLDFNGKQFGEAVTALGISKFRGAKLINSLEAFPLQYHRAVDEEKSKLIKCGRKFVSLMGMHHRRYQGTAFFMERGMINKVTVNGRIMIDPAFFRDSNPNYIKPRIDELGKHSSSDSIWFSFDDLSKKSDKIKSNGLEPAKMNEDDLLLCSPTVLGFSFGDKQWLEFAVADISDISWNPEPFQRLAIPFKRKKLIQALAASHMSRATRHSFDDFVVGKGRGLIMLLHGPPGVGKTLTAEGLSEHLEKPLYTVSCGELGTEVKHIEDQLSRAFRQSSHWNAILLLDEADVFMRQRSLDHGHNTIVSIFLRKLEYYEGIMFLTTNRVTDFDDAMQSRIHLAVKYPPLGPDTRKGVWESFLEKAVTDKGKARLSRKELDKLAEKDLNGRQIKNAVRAAHALASYEEAPVTYTYLETVLEMGDEFDSDFKGQGRVDGLRSYC